MRYFGLACLVTLYAGAFLGCASRRFGAIEAKTKADVAGELATESLPAELTCGPYISMIPPPGEDMFVRTNAYNFVSFSGLGTARLAVTEQQLYFNPQTKELYPLDGEAAGQSSWTLGQDNDFKKLFDSLVFREANQEGVLPYPYPMRGGTKTDDLDQRFDGAVAPLTQSRRWAVDKGVFRAVVVDRATVQEPISRYKVHEIFRDQESGQIFLRSASTQANAMTFLSRQEELRSGGRVSRTFIDYPGYDMFLREGGRSVAFEARCFTQAEESSLSDVQRMEVRPTVKHPLCATRLQRMIQIGLLRSQPKGSQHPATQAMIEELQGLKGEPAMDRRTQPGAEASDSGASDTEVSSGLSRQDYERKRAPELAKLEREDERDKDPVDCFFGGGQEQERETLERILRSPSAPERP